MLAQRYLVWAVIPFFIYLEVVALTIGEIKVEGNTLSSDRLIFKNIRARQGQEFRAHVRAHILDEDIKRLYELGRFKKIEVKESINGDTVDLTFIVEEKPMIANRSFKGSKALKSSVYEEEIQTTQGERYDEAIVKSDINKIKQSYKDHGFLFAMITHKVSFVKNKKDHVSVEFIINEKPQVKIGKIEFEGNHHIAAKRLLKFMETKVDRFYNKGVYDSEKFTTDLNKIQSYYQSLGYLDAKVTHGKSYFSGNKKWLYLKILISEGPLYVVNDIQFSGQKVVNKNELREKIHLKVGMPYSDREKYELKSELESFYGELGRVFTQLRIQAIIDEGKAHVVIKVDIQESEQVYLESIKLYGNTKTKDVVIRRELTFFPLERVNTLLIQESERNLRNLGFFENVIVDLEPGSKANYANAVVRVTEKQTGSINFALGFSSVESIFAQVKYVQRNFDWRDRSKGITSFFSGQGYIGDGQNLEVAINTGSESRRFTIDFNEPWVFNRKIRFGFGLFHTESSISDDFDEKRDGAYLRIGKEFKKDLEGFLTYSLSNVEISDIEPNVSPAIKEQEGENVVSSLRNDWIYDSRDNRFYPTKGWYLKPSIMLAGGPIGGTQDFYKLEFETKTYKKVFSFGVKNHHVLSGRLRLGFADEYGDAKSVPIFERFFAGGLGSVRGFENRSLGPKDGTFEVGGDFLTVFNMEYTFPISENTFRGVVFYDQGNVYESTSSFSYGDLRSAIGFGLRIQLDVLGPFPIALDFAKPIRKEDGDDTEAFSFNFGNFF